MNSRNLAVAMLLFAAAFPAAAQKPREGIGPAPPPVVSRAVAVQRGETVAIPLGIHGVRGEQLRFLIRTPPVHGRLSAISATGANAAVVRYTAPAKGAAAEDRFTYAAGGSEGVSAPGIVTISIVDSAPPAGKLVVPAELDFPTVVAGERSAVEMELANRGDGVVEGEAKAPAPWSLEGSGRFRINPGGTLRMTLVFEVEKPGTYSGDVVISGPTRTIVALRAVAEDRFAVTPPRLELVARPGSRTRTGSLRISNRSREDAKIEIAAGARLLTDRAIVVEGRETAEIPVFAEAGEVSAIDAEVKLSSGAWSVAIPVTAPAVGPVLRFAGDELVFGKVEPGEAKDAETTLENLGGTAVAVRLEVEPPFQLRTQTAVVPANGSVSVPIRLPTVDPGVHKSKLSAIAEGQMVSVGIIAEVPESPGTLAPELPPPAPPRDEGREPPERADAPEQETIYPLTVKEDPNGLGSFAREVTQTSAVIEWPVSVGGALNPRVEERALSLSPESELEIRWTPFSGVQFRREGERMRAELSGLQPASLYTMRVVEDRGDRPETVFTVQFWTPRRPPGFEMNWRLVGLVAATVTFLLLVWRRRKGQQGTGW